MPFDYLDKIAELSEQNLTVANQARIAENPMDLRYPAIFPVERVNSLKISGARTLVDDRPAGGRRDWNAQPRELTERVGPTIEAEVAPINTSHHLDERRLTELKGASQGVQQLVNAGVIADVTRWPPKLVDATERQLEAEAFQAWQTRQVVVLDTKSNTTVTITLPIDTARYVTEGTAWDDSGVNAFDLFVRRTETAIEQIGDVGAVRLRRNAMKTILADAPNQPNGVRATPAYLAERLNDELGTQGIALVIDERWYHPFTNGSTARGTKRYYVDPNRLLYQPRDGRIGTTYKAPVARAYDFLSSGQIAAGGAQDVVTFRTPKNDGKTLMLEAQQNSAALPDEQRVFVVNIGNTSQS